MFNEFFSIKNYSQPFSSKVFNFCSLTIEQTKGTIKLDVNMNKIN